MKYEFANVLVADTRLLVAANNRGPELDESSQPRILVLNNRLSAENNCPSPANKLRPPIEGGQSVTDCSNCCLRIEEPEFKKRADASLLPPLSASDSPDQSQQCFASCSERRLVNIELNTDSRIHGKLVLLALTRKLLPDVSPIAMGASLKCQTETSLFYSLFDHQHDKAASNRRQRLTRYARFKPNQVASLRVNSLEISWSNKLAGRELISIDIQAATASDRTRNKTTTQKQRIYANETLLVTELSCRSSSNSSDLQLARIHLLALINREPGQAANGRPASKLAPANSQSQDLQQHLQKGSDGKTQSATTKREAIIQQQTPQTILMTPSASSTESVVPASSGGGGGDDDDDKVGARQPADESQNSIETDIDRSSDQEASSNLFPSALDNQSSLLLGTGVRADGKRNHATNLLASGYSNQYNRQQLGGARALPDGLGESIRERLKSSSLLLFTVSSSLVILAYTLCLLVYLKGRRKSPTTTIAMARSRRSSSSAAAAALPAQAEQLNQQQQQTESSQMRISAPYNLQMPEPTRTRLEMMLRTDKRKQPDAACYHQPDSCLEPTSGARRPKKRHRNVDAPRALMDQQIVHSRARNSLESFVGRQAANANIEEPIVYYAPHPNVDNFSYSTSDFGYGTLQVVRAIRQAAAVARLKLRSSRYEPNLNVIHESDLEHLQQNAAAVNFNYAPATASAAPFVATKHCRFADQEENFSQTGGVACSEIDHLVQDSLKLECSHFIERMRLPSATLFSKPTNEHSHVAGSQTATGGDQVSRSGILKLVKQQQPQHQFVDKK